MSVNCTRSPIAKSAAPVLRLEPHVRAAPARRDRAAPGAARRSARPRRGWCRRTRTALASGSAAVSRVQAATRAARASAWSCVQVIAPARSNAATASANRPSARSRAAWRCQSVRWRVTSVISAAPWRCRSSVNSPPRSMLASWRSSPARITLAPARRASANSFAGDARYPASPPRPPSRRCARSQLVAPVLQPEQRRVHRARPRRNPRPSRSCATALVGARPITRRPSRSCASRIACSV